MAAKPKKVSDEAESLAWNKELSKRRAEKRKAGENAPATSRTKKRSGDA
jgi:hypothetical protein